MKLTYCNPLPLPDYQKGRQYTSRPDYKGPGYREMADPTVIRWQGRWYLFPSAGLLWHSGDMVNWEFHRIDEPFDPGYAPTVVQHGEFLYLSSSWDGSAIWRAKHPLGPWERLGKPGRDADNNPTWLTDENGEPVRWGDPCLFSDDDGALYCYCNLARPTKPGARWKLEGADGEIFGVRLRDDDPARFAHKPVKLFEWNADHIWERMGEHNQNLHMHILEGPWMNKINGRYYLQYSANGTEHTNYAVGCYTGEQPLGPFTYQKRNPILISRGGLVNGTAHHSVVEGPNGTFWCFYTTLVGIDYRFERRIGMDPVGFDENGEMFVAGPTETPQFAPGLVVEPTKNNNPGWIPLSVCTHATASSSAPGRDPGYAVDNHI
ncbi:MAG TPA: family 43 glycosylhydrolase, partial [Candidatus Methylacidiphilales bacterium]|nr:family 43 glycosylhydrolase [Candidatus Methylacidiphilales bacterium]